MFLQQFANALGLGAVYALFALGFTLIFGVLEIITLAHGAVFMVGAFAGLVIVTKFNVSPLIAILAGMLASGILGWLIDLAAVRPLRKREFHHLAPMIATIGCATIIVSISQGIFGAEVYRFPFDFMPVTSYTFWAIQMTSLQIIIIGVALCLMLIIIFLLNRTKWGKAVRAVAESPRTAALLGIPVERTFQLTAFVASALGGAAGVLTGINFNAVHAFMGGPIMHRGIAVIILGGMGDIRGAVLGGLILGFSEIMSVAYISSDFRDAVSFGLLFIILLVRPSGIFGSAIERKG
ncbi:MAG TPA: branched-chain amino acid ABC transporter permease [Syntrophorhabdaceae bacterium]